MRILEKTVRRLEAHAVIKTELNDVEALDGPDAVIKIVSNTVEAALDGPTAVDGPYHYHFDRYNCLSIAQPEVHSLLESLGAHQDCLQVVILLLFRFNIQVSCMTMSFIALELASARVRSH